MRIYRVIVLTQATYTLITAVWPLVDIKSFMEVTGYKRDVWLVKTVGALLIPIALALYAHLHFKSDHRTAFVLGCLTALAFACIDFYYALNDVIADIYLADGVVELIFVGGWIYIILSAKGTRLSE
jgi:hypothetical protein